MASTELTDTNEQDQRVAGAEANVTGAEALAGEPEAWEPWETRLVVGSLAIGAAGLVVLGWLVDHFILK